jgi:hypothetical protein
LKYIILKKNIMKFLKIELDNLEEKERCLWSNNSTRIKTKHKKTTGNSLWQDCEFVVTNVSLPLQEILS